MEGSQPGADGECVEGEVGQGGIGHDRVPHSGLEVQSVAIEESVSTALSSVQVHGAMPAGSDDARGGDSTLTLRARKMRYQLPPIDQGVIRDASSSQVEQELRRQVGSSSRPAGTSAEQGIDRFKAAAHIFKGPMFVGKNSTWPAVEKRFDSLGCDGLLPRSRFAQCIGMNDSKEFAMELFDALARRRNISIGGINKEQLKDFWNQISGQRSNTRLQPFTDMIDADADGRITVEDVKKIIMLSSSANRLHQMGTQAEEYASLIMEELDPDNHGYIETHMLERLLKETVSVSQWGARGASWGNDYKKVEITGGRVDDSTIIPRMMEKQSSLFGHAMIRNASSQVEEVEQELQRLSSISRHVGTSDGDGELIDSSKPSSSHALKVLKFIIKTSDGATEWPTVEKLFHELSSNGLLHRSKFGECIGTKELELDYVSKLFDALARRHNISANCINKAELLEFWDQISDQRFDSQLRIFFDIMEQGADARITEKEVKEIIILSSLANDKSKTQKNLEDTQGKEMSEQIHKNAGEYARLIMEELDPNNLFGYIETYNLQMMMMQVQSQSVGMGTTNSGNLQVQMNQSLRHTARLEPNLLKQWYQQTQWFLEDNWKRVWVMLLWLCICAGLFAWKFTQSRRTAVFHVMGSCICVAKGAAETLKFNMALILLPVCRNTITWIRTHTNICHLVPVDDNIKFHEVIAMGIAIGAGMHVVSHLACGFPRLLHATDAAYELMKLFFGEKRPANYWWFVTRAEWWTGLVMLVVMTVTFTLAMPWFRRGRARLPRLFSRLVGFNAFWYSHHLFVVVYALLIAHGHGLYLTHKWYNNTTWMYLSIPIFLYACERFTRVLRSVRPVKILKVIVYSGNVMSLHLSKPRGFKYKSGQYIFLNCAATSLLEWHPFYITSAPQDDHICIHMRTFGDWTRQTKNVFSEVCHPPLRTQSGLLRFENDRDDTRLPKVMIDGPYGDPAQDYGQYEAVLLIGLGIGVTPMISVVKDISDKIKLLDDHIDIESGAAVRRATTSFRTRHAYLYWLTREPESLEWFRGVTEEVAKTDKRGAIEFHEYCTSVYEEGDACSALVSVVNALRNDGVDVVFGTRIKTQFGRPSWRAVYKRVALNNRSKRVGVFYCGAPVLAKELREHAQHFSRKTSTKFEFHGNHM